MAKARSSGLMGRNILESSFLINEKDMASLCGTMAALIMASGGVESSMERAPIYHRMEGPSEVSGSTGAGSDGLIAIKSRFKSYTKGS